MTRGDSRARHGGKQRSCSAEPHALVPPYSSRYSSRRSLHFTIGLKQIDFAVRCSAALLMCWFIYGLPKASVVAQATSSRASVAVLDFGDVETGRRAAGALQQALAANESLRFVDRALARDAARGASYQGSLNMTLTEARDLGAAIGCDFYLTGDAQTLRRLPVNSSTPYFEAYASVFIVNARTGELLSWERKHFAAATREAAEQALLAALRRSATDDAKLLLVARRSNENVSSKIALMNSGDAGKNNALGATSQAAPDVIYEEMPAENSPDARNFRPPQPYRRLRPAYPTSAAEAEAEATIEVMVKVDAAGEVAGAQVERWGGFGLDDAALATVKQLHFRPAMRDGVPVPVRVLLRYNFRRPPKPESKA